MPCSYCEFRCKLEDGHSICGRYHMIDGRAEEKEPLFFLQPCFHELESMPFFHVEPGNQVLQIGTKSCNAGCDYCVNAHLSIMKSDYPLVHYTPQELVRMAKNRNVAGIIFAINEVTVFHPSAIQVAKAAHNDGLLVGCLTNGYQTEEAAIELAEHMDLINVSIKSLSADFYQKNLHLPDVAPVLRNARIFSEKSHLEIITPLAQEIEMAELYQIADYVESLGTHTPWHLFRLLQTHERKNAVGRDFAEEIRFTEKIRERLPYTYYGNFPGSRWADTLCSKCGHRVVRRISIGACGAQYLSQDLDSKDTCPKCGEKIPIVRIKKGAV